MGDTAGNGGGLPWATKLPKRHDLLPYEGALRSVVVYLIDEGDVWTVHCMDCGTRIGTVNAGNESGAVRLTEDHRRIIHG